MATKNTTFSYSKAMNELQTIVQQLHSGTIGIDELEQQLTKANQLLQQCKEKLRSVEEATAQQ